MPSMSSREFWQLSANVIENMQEQQQLQNPGAQQKQPGAAVQSAVSPNVGTKPQGWRGLGLRTKAIALSLILGTAPLAAAIGSAVYRHSVEEERVWEQALDQSQTDAIALANRTEEFLGDRLRDVQTLANLPLLVNLKVWYGLTPTERQGTLEQYLATYSIYDSITYLDPKGNVVMQTSGVTVENQSQQAYFQSALETGKGVYHVSDQGQFYFAAPVRDASNGNLLGVIQTRLRADALYNAVQESNGSDLFLLDSGDRYIMTPPDQSQRLGQSIEATFPGLSSTLSTSPASQRSGAENLSVVAHATVDDLAGIEAPQPQLTSLVSRRNTKLPVLSFQIDRTISLVLALGLASATLIIPALGLFWAARVSRVLRATAQTLDRLGTGDMAARVPLPRGNDELTGLARALNESAESIQTRFAQQQAYSASQAERFLAIARSRDLNEIRYLLTPTLNEFQQAMGADRMVVYRFTADKDGYVVGESVSEQWPSVVDLDIRDNCIPEALKQHYAQGRTVINDNVFHIDAALDPEHLWLLARLEIKANLIVPILQDGDLLGLLIANHCTEPHHWTDPEISMMEYFAQQLAMPLASYFAYEKRRLVAVQERRQSQDLKAAIAQLLSQVEGIASGDLTVRAEHMDGDLGILADFFNTIVENLCHIVTQVQRAASEVDGSVLKNDSSIRELAADAAQQAEKIAHALDSVEVMTTALQAVAERAQQASQASQQAAHTAEAGGVAMETTVDSILQVRDAVAETAKKVKRLGESSQQISKVVELINQIALKTNLLAVNAGIEASKAGEEGRGFAVVAEEVGALASQSAAATQEIEQIIVAIQQGTSEVVEAMENSTSQVVDGSRSVQEAKDSLQNILAVSQQVNQAFQDISHATISQAETSTTVKQLMAEMTQLSQDASLASNTVSQSLQQTVGVTQQLQASVQTFKVDASDV